MGKHYKTILHCWFLHTLYKRIGNVIIPEPHFTSREGHHFDLLFSQCWLNLSLLWPHLTAHVLAGPAGCWWSIDLVRRYAPFHSTDSWVRVGLRDSFWVFFANNIISRPNWDANSWHDVLSVDTNSLKHLPRRSSNNCDLQFANIDRRTDRQT